MTTQLPVSLGVQVLPCTPEQAVQLEQLAVADKHAVFAPTHSLVKDEELVGYLSLGAATTVLLWFHSQQMKARDSIMVTQVYENLLRAAGPRPILIPINPESPMIPYLERVGYRDLGLVRMFGKIL